MYGLNFCNVYELCNKYRWFTEGTTEQYNKMLRMVDEKAPIEEVAPLYGFVPTRISGAGEIFSLFLMRH